MKKNIFYTIIVTAIFILIGGKGFAQKSSSNNPKMVNDTIQNQQQVPKHKVEGKKQNNTQAAVDNDTDTLSPAKKNKLIINKKKQ